MRKFKVNGLSVIIKGEIIKQNENHSVCIYSDTECTDKGLVAIIPSGFPVYEVSQSKGKGDHSSH